MNDRPTGQGLVPAGVLTAVLGSMILTACGPRGASDEELSFDLQPAESTERIAPVASVERPDATVPPSAEVTPRSSPFRVGALLDRGEGQVLVGLVEEGGETYNLLREGDTFRGYEVIRIDALSEQVYLERDGIRYVARVQPQAPAPVALDAARPRVLNAETFADGPRERFEPTPEERARGIDPNDPATWPERGYRGPGIERAGMDPVQFAPLDFEEEQGIDPNDPDTWPPGYRGPGIERAMRGLLERQD